MIQVSRYPVPLWPGRKRETPTPRKIEPDANIVDNDGNQNSWGGETDSGNILCVHDFKTERAIFNLDQTNTVTRQLEQDMKARSDLPFPLGGSSESVTQMDELWRAQPHNYPCSQ